MMLIEHKYIQVMKKILKFNSVCCPCNRPWRAKGVFPARYEIHLHIKSIAIPLRDRGGP
jgi:hypothetical protein